MKIDWTSLIEKLVGFDYIDYQVENSIWIQMNQIPFNDNWQVLENLFKYSN